MQIDTELIDNLVEQVKDPGLLENLLAFLKAHILGLPTGAAALIVLVLALKLKKLILTLLSLALLAAAIYFFVVK